MNERIKELAEQATMIKEVDCEGYLGRSYTRQEEYFDKEKFAELIVRECINVIRAEYVNLGTTAAVNNIEKHFGV
jgi:hypothetical protein